jgi:hypothetical protein
MALFETFFWEGALEFVLKGWKEWNGRKEGKEWNGMEGIEGMEEWKESLVKPCV